MDLIVSVPEFTYILYLFLDFNIIYSRFLFISDLVWRKANRKTQKYSRLPLLQTLRDKNFQATLV